MWTKILLLFFVFSFLFKSDSAFDQDLGRHLKLGEIILQARSVPKTNLFSYTNPDFPFINTHWLFEVLSYMASQTIGLQALLILKVVIFLAAVWLIFKIIPKENTALLLPVGFIFLHVLRERLDLRPEIFSFLFTAGTYFILEKYTKKPTRLIYLLPLIQLIWVNTHIYFFVGLILQAIFLIYLGHQHLCLHLRGVKLKLLGLTFILSVLVSLINPNGLQGLLYPLTVGNNYGYTIVENQTIFWLEGINFKNPNFLFVKLSTVIIIFSILITFLRKNFGIKNILLCILGIVLALANVRSFPYLVFLSLPAALSNLGPVRPAKITGFLTSFFALFLILESFAYLNGSYYLKSSSTDTPKLSLIENGKKTMDFALANNLQGPIYNNFDIGSYIIYRSYPRHKVFADGRPEAYPKDFFQNIYIPSQYDMQKFKGLDNQYNFKTIIFSHTDQTPWGKTFLSNIVKNPGWKIVYLDDFMIILVKNDGSSGSLQPINLAALDPSNYTFHSHVSYLRLALFLQQTGNLEAAQKFAASGDYLRAFLDLKKK